MRYVAFAALSCGAFMLGGCEPGGEAAEDGRVAAPTEVPSPTPAAILVPEESGDAAADEPAELTEAQRRGEVGARAVLLAWARALERKDFVEARSLFGERGASGAPDYAERLARFDSITVAAPLGRMEGAAGSLYYSAPVTVTATDSSGARTVLQGPVVLRRANDVPGATPEQLRWRVESVELEPVS